MSETRDQARTRRRWITLAELVAVVGVVIAALGAWNSWSERRAAESDKAVERSSEERAKQRVDLTGTVTDGGRRITVADAEHDLVEASFRFPAALGVPVQSPVGEPAIEADWVRKPLLQLTDGGADERTGRLPVLVTVSYWDDDVNRRSAAIYNVVWRTQGHAFSGRTLQLESMKLRERAGTPAKLEAAWVREKP